MRAGKYVALRDKIKEIKKKHEAELAPFNTALARLGGMIQEHLHKTNAQSVRTGSGTAYLSRKTSASIADRNAFLKWVLGTKEGTDFLDVKANVTAVDAYLAKQEEASKTDPSIIPTAPPGINFHEMHVIRVKR